MVARFRKRLFAALTRADITFFDKTQSGELVTRLASDSAVIQNAVTVNVSSKNDCFRLYHEIFILVTALTYIHYLIWTPFSTFLETQRYQWHYVMLHNLLLV